MGHRASLAVVTERGYDLYYNHWCANTLELDLFFGPAHALAFITAQERVDPASGWLDDVWSEGGVVLDPKRKVVLFFGGEEISWEVPLRKTFLDVMRFAWEGWEVRWAHEGISALVEYVGVNRNAVLTRERNTDKYNPSVYKLPGEWDPDNLATVIFEDGATLYFGFHGHTDECLLFGPAFADKFTPQDGVDEFDYSLHRQDFPRSGLVIDKRNKTINWWQADTFEPPESSIQSRWSGWQVTWQRDNYESQLNVPPHRLRFHRYEREELLKHVESLLDVPPRESGAVSAASVTEALRASGNDVQWVNPMINADVPINLDANSKRAILDAALARARAASGE